MGRNEHGDSYQETLRRINKSVLKLQQLSLQPELRDGEHQDCPYKDKIIDKKNLSSHAKGQTRTYKLAIKGLTTDLGYVRTNVDLQEDRLGS